MLGTEKDPFKSNEYWHNDYSIIFFKSMRIITSILMTTNVRLKYWHDVKQIH